MEPRKTQLSIFTSNVGWAVEPNDTTRTGGVGLALSRSLTRNWSAEIKVAREQHYAQVTHFAAAPVSPVTERVRFNEYPVDVLAQYCIVTGSRWTPYVNGGFRYVGAPDYGSSPNHIFGNRYDVQVGVGADLRITPHFGLRFDANRLLRSTDAVYDPLFRPSLGLKWRF